MRRVHYFCDLCGEEITDDHHVRETEVKAVFKKPPEMIGETMWNQDLEFRVDFKIRVRKGSEDFKEHPDLHPWCLRAILHKADGDGTLWVGALRGDPEVMAASLEDIKAHIQKDFDPQLEPQDDGSYVSKHPLALGWVIRQVPIL
jgi:hypothetical protein